MTTRIGQTLVVVLAALFSEGCSGADKPELTPCELKATACQNSCFKAGGNPGCLNCCIDNRDACQKGESYSFYPCPDKE